MASRVLGLLLIASGFFLGAGCGSRPAGEEVWAEVNGQPILAAQVEKYYERQVANLPEPLVRRRLVPGRVSRARDSDRLRAEIGVKWRAVRQGTYPWWCAIFLAKPLAGLSLPVPVRERARRVLGRRLPVSG